MDLKKTPFSDFENKKKYTINTFTEKGTTVNLLNETVPKKKIPSGNFYKFGILENGAYFWFFNGMVVKSRAKMLEVSKALYKVYGHTESVAFAYKVKYSK